MDVHTNKGTDDCKKLPECKKGLLWTYFHGKGVRGDDAEDLVQEAWVDFLEAAPGKPIVKEKGCTCIATITVLLKCSMVKWIGWLFTLLASALRIAYLFAETCFISRLNKQ